MPNIYKVVFVKEMSTILRTNHTMNPITIFSFTCLVVTVPVFYYTRLLLQRLFKFIFAKVMKKDSQATKASESLFYFIQFSFLFGLGRSVVLKKRI